MTMHYEDYELTAAQEERMFGADAQPSQEEVEAAQEAAAIEEMYQNAPVAWRENPATEYLKWLDTVSITEAVFQRLMKDRDGEAAK